MLLVSMIFGAIGFAYFYLQQPKYKATSTFILEEKSQSVGGLSSIASQFGVDIGGLSGGGSILAGDNILDILQSKAIITKVLVTAVQGKGQQSTTLADLYLKFTDYTKKWKNNKELNNISFNNVVNTFKLSPIQDSVLQIICSEIQKKYLKVERAGKKSSIITVTVTCKNKEFAKLLNIGLIKESGDLYYKIKTGITENNIAKMQRRSDSLLNLLNRKTANVALTTPLDLNPANKIGIVPVEIASRDKLVISTLYTEVTKNLEASKLMLSQQTPVIHLLDSPGEALFDNKKSKTTLAIVGLIVGFFCGMAIVLIKNFHLIK